GARVSEERPPAGGAGKGPEPSGVDLARVALRAAREAARARGDAAQQKKQARRGGLRSGARADGQDPMALGAAINRLLTERGWEAPAAVGGVMGRWPEIVGEDVAKHCEPERYDEAPPVPPAASGPCAPPEAPAPVTRTGDRAASPSPPVPRDRLHIEASQRGVRTVGTRFVAGPHTVANRHLTPK